MNSQKKSVLAIMIERCRSGNEEAWSELMEIVSPVIFSVCRGMSIPREETFDVFGQVSFLLLKNLNSLRSAEKLMNYVATITRREVFSLHRKAKADKYLRDIPFHLIPISDEETPDSLYESSLAAEKLTEAMAHLPERDYFLLKALFLDNQKPNYEEISKRLDIPVSSIGPYRARSLQKLYRILKKKRFNFLGYHFEGNKLK